MIEKDFVTEGLRRTRIDEYLEKELERAGYGGMDVQITPLGTMVIVYAERPGMVIGRGGKNVRTIHAIFRINNIWKYRKPHIIFTRSCQRCRPKNFGRIEYSCGNSMVVYWNSSYRCGNAICRLHQLHRRTCNFHIGYPVRCRSGKKHQIQRKCIKWLTGKIMLHLQDFSSLET